MNNEDKVLEWLLSYKDSPTDVIELVDRKMLEMLLEEAENVAVFFCKYISLLCSVVCVTHIITQCLL